MIVQFSIFCFCKEFKMPDDKIIRAPLDKKRIDIHDPQEVRNWTKSLKCTEAELIAAVKKVGDSAEAVKKELKL